MTNGFASALLRAAGPIIEGAATHCGPTFWFSDSAGRTPRERQPQPRAWLRNGSAEAQRSIAMQRYTTRTANYEAAVPPTVARATTPNQIRLRTTCESYARSMPLRCAARSWRGHPVWHNSRYQLRRANHRRSRAASRAAGGRLTTAPARRASACPSACRRSPETRPYHRSRASHCSLRRRGTT